MRNLLNLSAVILLCMLSLFFTQLDIRFMLALLCAVILCCLCFLLENRIAFSMVALCFFAVSVFIPAFLFFWIILRQEIRLLHPLIDIIHQSFP